jgi:enoyl-CoA hydratase/carnithine racemase
MIRSEQDGRVRRITLAAPLHRNVVNSESSRAFLSELADAESDEGTGAILLDAEGQIFCGGMDYNDLPVPEFFNFGQRATKPVVVSMQGVAVSAGVALLANAHIVVAAQGSSFGLTDLREGRYHSELLQAVERAVGERRVRELALTGRIFTTPEALQWGLVHAAAPAFELDDRVFAVAQGVAAADAETMRRILQRS